MPPLGLARQRRKEARPQELLEAALQVFVEKGFAAARTDDVAARAGVAKGTLYLYFSSKDELLKAVIRHFIAAEIQAGAAEAAAFVGSSSDLMRQVAVPWWQRLVDSPASGVIKLVVTEVRNFPEIAEFYSREVIEPGHRTLAGIIERGIRSGEFRAVDVHSTVFSLMLPMVMLCLHQHSIAPCLQTAMIEPHRFIRDHVELILEALRPGTAPDDPAPRVRGVLAA